MDGDLVSYFDQGAGVKTLTNKTQELKVPWYAKFIMPGVSNVLEASHNLYRSGTAHLLDAFH
jgi:hypothetical protein